jgi:hypothetical protein
MEVGGIVRRGQAPALRKKSSKTTSEVVDNNLECDICQYKFEKNIFVEYFRL